MKVLHLTLKKKWFDMISSGEKKEEYREIKQYWCSRLLYRIDVPWGGCLTPMADIINKDFLFEGWKRATGNSPWFKAFDVIHFKNGYGLNSPVSIFKFEGIEIREGNQAWGAEPGKKYFVIKLGELIELTNKYETGEGWLTPKD